MVKVKLDKVTPAPKFPYLAYDTRSRLCLVGKYSAIVLESETGDGYSNESYPKIFTPHGWTQLAAGQNVTLTQD